MQAKFQARRISKQRIDFVRKSGRMKDAIVLDSFSGFLIVEPVGSDLGDGDVLDATEAEYRLVPHNQVEAQRGPQAPWPGEGSTVRSNRARSLDYIAWSAKSRPKV